LEPIVAKDPRHTEARYQLAIVLREEGRPEEAQAHFQKAREINEKLASANDLAERITPGPGSSDARLEIAKIFLEYGSRREGLMWLRSVLTFSPDHSGALKELEAYYRKRFSEEPSSTRFNELADEYQRRLTASQ
ncbi:MAG: tetratricopeptide repeat protein, partial [Planctomycetaceae bacterium]|nr:tetratricopeptide repeat protein [Planctomycetaceae bacterium]